MDIPSVGIRSSKVVAEKLVDSFLQQFQNIFVRLAVSLSRLPAKEFLSSITCAACAVIASIVETENIASAVSKIRLYQKLA